MRGNVAASAARSQCRAGLASAAWLPDDLPGPYHPAALAPPRGHERWPMTSLRTLLAQPPIVVAPGCYDALSALMIERAGFPAAYFSGASLAYTRFGRPDIGLIAMDEVVDAV